MAKNYFQLSLISAALMSSTAWADSLKAIDVSVSNETLATGYSPTQSVAGRKSTTALMRTPISVEVVSNKLMKDQGVDHVIDALNYHSGIVSNYRGSNQRMEITIRGVGNKANSNGGTVPTYVNGVSYAADYAIRPFFLERIDIVKGPNSVLYGQSNPGGVMDIVTKKAQGKNQGELQFILGSNQRYQVGVDVERRLTDSLSARVVGQFERTNWKENYVKEQGGAISPSILWQPSDNTSLAVFIENPSLQTRGQELPPNPTFAQALTQELVPSVEQKIGVKAQQRIIGGSSYGGLASAYMSLRYPRVFQKALILSGSFWWHPKGSPSTQENYIAYEFAQRETLPLCFFMSAGYFDQGNEVIAQALNKINSLGQLFGKTKEAQALHQDIV